MLHPVQFDEAAAVARGVQPGWWAVDADETPVFGPYPSREAVLVAIANHGRTVDPARP